MENIKRIIDDLGENYRGDEEIIQDILDEVSSIASDISNRKANDERLYPYIKKTTKAIYLTRGAEGMQSTSEAGVSSSFEDIIEKMRNDIVKNGLRRLR